MSELTDADIWRSGGMGYDPEWARAWLREHVIKRLRLPCGVVLDAGCGDGFWSAALQDLGCVVCGVDFNEAAIEAAQEHWPGPSYAVADLTGALPLPPDHYDWVLARNLPHWYRDDLFPETARIVVANMLAHVRAGGCIAVVAHSPRAGLETMIRRAPARISQRWGADGYLILKVQR